MNRFGTYLAAGAMVFGFALTPSVGFAKDKKKDKDKGKDKDRYEHRDRDHDNDRDRYSYKGKKQKYSERYYRQVPRSSFSLVFGNGYSGPGYYYGPQDADYFYQSPGVSYYRTADAYQGRVVYPQRNSLEVSVQRSLARRGYYRGPIDGDLGPMSRRSIARFQEDVGLRPTGALTRSTLEELGIGN